MPGVENTANYPTDQGSRHALGATNDDGSTFHWLRSTAGKLLKMVLPGAPTYANGQVTATTTAATLLAARAARRSVLFVNMGTARVYIGAATVTAANGVPLDPGQSVVLNITTLIQCLAASGSQAIAYLEEYD